MAQTPTHKAGLAALGLAALLMAGQAARLAIAGAPPGRWVGLDVALQCWSMSVLALMAIQARISLAGWGWCAMAALPLALGDPLANHVHPWLMSHGLYPPFWGRGNDPQQSPQYARLLIWSIALVAAWARVGWSRRLGRDPMSTLSILAASSVFATSLVFHVAALWIAQDRQAELAGQARAAMALPSDEAFAGYCSAASALCGSGEAAVEAVLDSMPMLGVEQARASLAAARASGPGAFAFWRQATEAKSFNRLPSMAAAAGVGPAGQPRLWVDTVALPRALGLGERVFALLALCAHALWLWGAIWLGWWHGRMMERKRARGASLTAPGSPL